MPSPTNRLLGYPDDARLLIINADDFGFCHSINDAIWQTLRAGVVGSTTLMMPCPAASAAIDLLQAHPEQPFGVHLTVICDTITQQFGPLTPKEMVPSLVNEEGHFYNFERMDELRARATLADLETEFRAQIEAVLAAGLHPTHLDWHAVRFGHRTDIPALMTGLAKEYGLALRVIGQPWIDQVQGQGLPTIDYTFLDSFGLDPATKADQLCQLVRELPAGLSEWAVHPGLATAELQALQPDGIQQRQSDFAVLMAGDIQQTIRAEGIILLDYGALQRLWRAGVS